MRRLAIIFIAAGCLVGSLAVVAHAASARTQSGKLPGTKDTRRLMTAAIIPDSVRLQQMGFATPETTVATKLTAAQAIAKARTIVTFDPSQAGVSVTTRKVMFTMQGFKGALPNGVVPNNLAAWVVTLGGMKWPAHHGINTPEPAPFTEMNIVVDANTGAEVTEYAYK